MKIAEGVYRPEGLRASNAYVLVSEGDVALIDTGAAQAWLPCAACLAPVSAGASTPQRMLRAGAVVPA